MQVEDQLRNFVEVLHRGGNVDELLPILVTGVKFLENKHNTRIVLVHDTLDKQAAYIHPLLGEKTGPEFEKARMALRAAHRAETHSSCMLPGSTYQLPANSYLMLTAVVQDPDSQRHSDGSWHRFKRWFTGKIETAWEPLQGGLVIALPDTPHQHTVEDFQYDARMFLRNWNLAYTTLQLQENVAREKALSAEAFWYLDAPRKTSP